MRHHINKMAWFAWTTVVIFTVVFALLVTFLRIVTPMLENYTEQIKSYIFQSIKHPVRIGAITSDWYGFGPVIEIKDIEIYDNDEKNILLSADYARLRFSLFELIRHLSLVPASLSIEKGNLTLTYSEGNQWSVLGIGDDNKDKSPTGSIFEWTPARQRIDFNDFTIKINAYDGSHYQFDQVNASIDDDGSTTKLQINADWQEPTVSKVTLMGEFDSRSLGNQRLEGRLYTYFSKADWASLAIFAPKLPAQIKQGSGSLELWTDWLSGSIYKVQTQLAWDDLILQFPSTTAPLEVDKLTGTFVWLAPDADRWVFLGNDVIIQANETVTSPTDFKWSHNIVSDNENVFEMENVNLATIATLLNEIPEFSPYQAQFIQLKPAGYFSNFRFDMRTPEDKPMEFSLESSFSELSFTGLPHVTLISGLSGSIDTTEKQGKLILASEHFRAVMPEYFSHEWHLDLLNATIDWEKNKHGWKITADPLNVVANPTEKAALRGLLTLPSDPERSPFVELLATIPSIELKDALEFVPDKKLSPKFENWLEQAFPTGRLENATLVIRGPTRDFPFDNGTGKFEIHSFLKDTTLSYHPQWPKVDNIQAELVLSGRRMDATILQGTLAGSQIQRSVVTIPYIGPDHPMVVEVPGVLTGTANSGMKFLQDSPLWSKLGADLSALRFNGPIKVNLDLAFPLGQPDIPPTVLGTIGLDKAQVVIPELDLSFDNVVGTLGFSDKAVTAHDLQAELFGRPVEADVDTVTQFNQPDYLQFRVSGSADPSILRKRYPDPIWNYFNGVFNYTALLERHHTPDPQASWFLLSSDLKGLKVDLPIPLNKPANEVDEFYYKSTVGTPGQTEVRVKYGNKLVTHLAFAQNKGKAELKRGAVVINSGEPPPLPNETGLQISGKMDHISLDDWIPFTMDYIAERAKFATAATIQTQVRAKLDINSLDFVQRSFSVATLTANSMNNQWQFNAQGKDLAGSVILPAVSSEPLLVNFDHLYWPAASKVEASKQKNPKVKGSTLPAADVNINNLLVNQRLIGKIHVSTQKTANGLNFSNIVVTHPDYTVSGEGQWSEQNGVERTLAKGKVESKDLGKALQYWGMNTDIKDAKIDADYQLAWPGSPADFHLNTFSGQADLKIEDGRIVEIKPGGFGRILGLVNLDSLKRRLRLDFSDVLKQGFTFDELTGHFIFRNGVATTDDTLISSSATKISVTGTTNLVNQQLDLRIIVMPHLLGPLPIATAIAINPIAGAAVWVADKLLGPEIQQLAQYWYSVTGTWSTPKVEPMERGAPTRRKR